MPSAGGPWTPPAPDGETHGKGNPPIDVVKMMEEQGRHGLLISGVISWIEVERHRGAGEVWKEVAKQCFLPKEVSSAKKQLVTVLNGEQIVELKKIGVTPTRQETENPNVRKKTEIDDIEKILAYLSTNKVMPLVLATTCQIRMSPKSLGSVNPEATMGDMLTKVQSLEGCMKGFMDSVSRQMETLTEVVTEQRTPPGQAAEVVIDQRRLHTQITKRNGNTPAKKRKLEDGTEVSEIEVVDDKQEKTYADIANKEFNPQRRSSLSLPPRQSKKQLLKTALDNTNVKEKMNEKPKSKIIFHGKAATTDENGAVENNLAADVELVAFNVFKDAEPEHLEKFLKDKGITVKEVKLLTKIELITSGTVRSKSMKVTVTAAEHEKAMNPDVWPYRVGVRYYKADRPRKSNPEGEGSSAEDGGLQERDQRDHHDRDGQDSQHGRSQRGNRGRGRRNQYTEVGG